MCDGVYLLAVYRPLKAQRNGDFLKQGLSNETDMLRGEVPHTGCTHCTAATACFKPRAAMLPCLNRQHRKHMARLDSGGAPQSMTHNRVQQITAFKPSRYASGEQTHKAQIGQFAIADASSARLLQPRVGRGGL